MAKMHGHYFGRGRKIMTRYFRRNASGLLLYFAYSIARIVGDVLLILLPVFATSSFNSAHMLKETGDLYLSKSFDHAEDEKSYRSLLLFAAVVVLGAGALIAGLIFLNEYIRFILFWLFSCGILEFNHKWVRYHSLPKRILPNMLFTVLAFALYKYVTYLICPGFDRYGMIPTFQFIVMGIMGLLLGYTDYLSRIHQKRKAELQLLKIESLESRCTALTNQINPHFFFNSLGGIKQSGEKEG